jgi:hypothetical protein
MTDEESDDENLTTSQQERWEYIGTILAGVIVLSLPVLILGAAIGELSLGRVGQAWYTLYSIVVLTATTWAFGKGTLEAVYEARSG